MELEKIVSSLTKKKVPVKIIDRLFDTLVNEAEQEERARQQRKNDIAERALVLKERSELLKRHISESIISNQRIEKAREALTEALNAGAAIGRKQVADIFGYDQKIAELENRLRESCPQSFYDRVNVIDKEIDRLSRVSYSSDSPIAGRGSSNLKKASERVAELRKERDFITGIKIFEEYGLDDEEVGNV